MPDYTRSRRIDPEGWPREVPRWQRRTPRTMREAFGDSRRIDSCPGPRAAWIAVAAVFAGAIALIFALALL